MGASPVVGSIRAASASSSSCWLHHSPKAYHRLRPSASSRAASSTPSNQATLQNANHYTSMIHACAKLGDAHRAKWWFTQMQSANFEPDLQAYNTLLDACGGAGEMNIIDELLSSMQAPDAYSYCAAIRGCERGGDVIRAEEYFEMMLRSGVQPTTVVYNAMIGVCASAGDAERAAEWLETIKDCSHAMPDVISFNSVISAYAKQGQVEKAISCFWLMYDEGVRPDKVSFASVASACTAAKQMDKAERWLKDVIRENKVSAAVFNCMIDGYGKLGDIERAREKFDQLSQLTQPSLASHNSLIHAYAQAGDMRTAVGCLTPLRRQGLSPDVLTYTAIIGGFAQLGRTKNMKEWFETMCSAQLEPTPVTYAALLTGCRKKHDVAGARRILAEMEGRGHKANNVIFNLVISIFASARKHLEAESTLRQMEAAKLPLDMNSYGAVVKAAGRAGDPLRVAAWHSRMLVAGYAPDAPAYYALLTSCGVVGDLVLADGVVEAMRAQGIQEDVVSHTSLIVACAPRAQLAEAERRFETMRAAGVLPNAYTLNAMMEVCIKANDPVSAERWFLHATRLGANPEVVSFNGLMRAWAAVAVGDAGRVAGWFARMESASHTPDVISFNTAINVCARADDPHAAVRAYKQLKEEGWKPSQGTYRALLKTLAHHGEYMWVQELLGEMKAAGLPRDPICDRTLIAACAAAGPEAAREAEAAFMVAPVALRQDDYALQCLANAVGQRRYDALARTLGLRPKRSRAASTSSAQQVRPSPAAHEGVSSAMTEDATSTTAQAVHKVGRREEQPQQAAAAPQQPTPTTSWPAGRPTRNLFAISAWSVYAPPPPEPIVAAAPAEAVAAAWATDKGPTNDHFVGDLEEDKHPAKEQEAEAPVPAFVLETTAGPRIATSKPQAQASTPWQGARFRLGTAER